MKKVSVIIIIFVLLVCLMPFNIEVRAASIKLSDYLYGGGFTDDTFFEKKSKTDTLHEEINDGSVSKNNQKKCDEIAIKDKDDLASFFDGMIPGDQEIRFGVRYNWLHATVNLLKKIDGNKYTDFVNSNNKEEHFKDAIEGLKLARTQLGTFVGDPCEITDGDTSFYHPIWKENAGYDNSEVLSDSIRSAKAFAKITNDFTGEDIDGTAMNTKIYEESEIIRNSYLKALGKFDAKITDAIRELHAALDTTTGKGSCEKAKRININDEYKEKFMYTDTEIKYYDIFYSMGRIGTSITGSSEKEQLKRCWGAKVAAPGAGYENVAKRTDLYVKKGHDLKTKLAYDKDQVWLYIQIFDPKDGDFTNFKVGSKEFGETVVAWANTLKGKKEYSADNISDINSALAYLRGIENVVQKGIDEINKATGQYDGVTSNYEQDADASASASNADADARNGDDKEKKEDKDKDTVFLQPIGTGNNSNGVQDAISDAESFVTSGSTDGIISEGNLQEFSQNLYSILLSIGVVISVIIGVILGVKLMLAPIGERAEAKKLLIPYVVGCVIVFGAFGIWKLVVTIMQGM